MPTDAPRRRIVAVDEAAVDTVLEGLRQEADRRKRVATRLAGEVINGPDGKADQRPDALKIARFLATAARLEQVAAALEAAEPAELVTIAPLDADAITEALEAAHDRTTATAAKATRKAAAARKRQPTTTPTDDEPAGDDDVAEALDAMGMTPETP